MIWSEKLGYEIGTYNSLGGLRINPKPFIHSTEPPKPKTSGFMAAGVAGAIAGLVLIGFIVDSKVGK